MRARQQNELLTSSDYGETKSKICADRRRNFLIFGEDFLSLEKPTLDSYSRDREEYSEAPAS